MKRLRCKLRSLRARLGLFTPRTTWDGHCWASAELDFFAAPNVPIYAVRCVDCKTLEVMEA